MNVSSAQVGLCSLAQLGVVSLVTKSTGNVIVLI